MFRIYKPLGFNMGTDVHSIIEVKKEVFLEKHPELRHLVHPSQIWVQIPENPWAENRSYLLFAVLANVRNGFGFGGFFRHEPLKPITDQRGIPDDFSAIDYVNDHWEDHHSHTWLLGSEFSDWFNGDLISLVHSGYISKEKFETWDGNTPDCYSGFVSGYGVVLGDDLNSLTRTNSINLKEDVPITPISSETTHVRVWWAETVQSSISYFYDDVVKPLIDQYGDFRLVMSFDS